ncbi:MAG: hypothetical protein HY901_14050 [Deltaproteobacteria bacterium]|nr:hypothetical protein [Deltaproteobacteria bacterium]
MVKLNDADPAPGYLESPRSPKNQRPRLEVAFGVNKERWLCATVLDLRSKRHLMREQPGVTSLSCVSCSRPFLRV